MTPLFIFSIDEKRKRKVRKDDDVVLAVSKAVVGQVLSYLKTVFWSLRLI